MKKLLLILLSVLLCVSLVACANTAPSTPPPGATQAPAKLETISVSEVTRSVFYAPQYAAIAKGFFEEEGLEIELATGQGADKVMTSVIANEVDIGFSGPEAAIYVYNEGRENHAVVFAQLTKRDGSFLMGREPVEQFSWEMVRGKHVLGGRKGGVPEMTLEYVLRQNGLEPGVDVNVDTSVQFALMAGAFTGGTADFTTLFEPTASMVEAEGKGYVLCSIGEESGEIPYTCYYASKKLIAEKPEMIQSFTNAIYKGQQWVATHSAAEIAEAIAPFFPDTSLELLTTVTQRHKDIDAFMSDPILKRESFDRLQTVMEQAGVLPKRADYDAMVNTEFAANAMK